MASESSPSNRTIGSQLRRACLGFDVNDRNKVNSLASVLNSVAQDLTKGEHVRRATGQDQALWSDLRRIWRDLARTQLTFWDNDDDDSDVEEGEELGSSSGNNHLRNLCQAAGKFTRNIVAGVPDNQARAYDNEPEIRRLLHYYTSWSAMEDPESTATARILTQTLSNIVTSNQALVTALWDSYMNLPEDQVVIIRLLGSKDNRTLLTTLIFVLNCIHGSRKRTKMLARTTIGARICVALLDGMVSLYDEDEDTEGGKAFNVGYAIFTRLIEEGTIPDLFKKFMMPDEIIAPHQTTLLKLVDSYLQSIRAQMGGSPTPELLQIHVSLGPFLAKRFFTLSVYAQNAMQNSLGPTNGSSSGEPLKELDVMLPKVCEALVLVTQCITTIALEAEESNDQHFDAVGTITNMKEFFIDVRFSGQGLVENLIDTLRLLDLFLPRIYFGKPVPNPHPNAAPVNVTGKDNHGFSYVKRDLVRLLGVLGHESRVVQDRVRASDGLPVVMNMCVVDERNPFLREHAIFTLQALLKDNTDNKAFVDSIRPNAEFDDAGILKDKFGALRI